MQILLILITTISQALAQNPWVPNCETFAPCMDPCPGKCAKGETCVTTKPYYRQANCYKCPIAKCIPNPTTQAHLKLCKEAQNCPKPVCDSQCPTDKCVSRKPLGPTKDCLMCDVASCVETDAEPIVVPAAPAGPVNPITPLPQCGACKDNLPSKCGWCPNNNCKVISRYNQKKKCYECPEAKCMLGSGV